MASDLRWLWHIQTIPPAISSQGDKTLNVVLLTPEHHRDRPSGAAKLAFDQSINLVAAGHQVSVVGHAVNEKYREHEQCDGIYYLRYKTPKLHLADPRRAFAHQTAAKEILARKIQGGVDVIHGHAPLSFLAACDVFPRVRKVYSIHSPMSMEMELTWSRPMLGDRLRRWFGTPVLNRMERKCLELSDAVSAESEFTKQQMERLHGKNLARKVQVIPGWVDLDRFSIVQDRAATKISLGWPSDAPVLFTLRRLVARMGLDRLIHAVSTVRDRGQQMHLVIGGSGPLETELRQLVTSLDLDSWVRFIGRVPDIDLPIMYGTCDAFVLPTAALECFGLIAIEALACGRPVLATPVGAIPEVINNFEPRWLSRSNDHDAIADLLSEYLSGALPSHAPAALRRRTEELYSQDARVSELVKFALPETKSAPQIDISHEVRAH
ncbi:MAG: glycosyltransferase family 4 protein [Candidatus Angelobacter sp.]